MIKSIDRLILVLLGGLLANSFAANHPNVVIIYGDDVGYGDVGAYGSTLIPTPNIDRLAGSRMAIARQRPVPPRAFRCSPGCMDFVTASGFFLRTPP